MLKIRALNRDASSDEDAPEIRKEAQEEIALDLYNKALRLQCSNDLDEALAILHKLLEENIPQLESQGGLPKTMSTIKYSCYINIGSISVLKGEKQYALENFLTASELDKTDVTLWYKIGMLALKLDRFRQASYAFYKGLECSESHWPCMDQLISVLFATQDTIGCLEYIDKALLLDPYYMKGLVLRKNIYDNNPATQEYYKLYNANHVHEPKIDLEISEEDEKLYLDEIGELCTRITEVEKSLQPKPLPTIALPTPLDDFTWVALGKTLTNLHRYISTNNMSHLTKINLNKCMSTNKSVDDDVVMMIEEEIPIKTDEVKKADENTPAETKPADNVEESECPEVVERRMSQASDENNATPVQTEEEMEQDAEDQEDPIQKPAFNKGNKRKRDLVSDLQIWGWHSKRKSTKRGKNEKDYTIENALTRIIPPHLLPNGINADKYNPMEDSMSTMDLYNLHVKENQPTEKMLSPIGSPSDCLGNYFGSEEEKEDVKKFWSRDWKNCDAIDLIEAYVYAVAFLWKVKWPEKLTALYIDAYLMFREHCSHPPTYNSEISFDRFKEDALATILYGELTTYSNKKEHIENEIHCTSVSQLILLSAWDEHWGSEYNIFSIRIHWMRAHLFKRKGDNNLAIMALQLVQDLIKASNEVDKFRLVLPNCSIYSIITSAVIEKMLNNLELIDSLSRLEELYDSQKYNEVAKIIKATFANTSNHVSYGKMGRPAQLGLLMHSLWFTDLVDCFIWTEECLNEALGHFIKPTVYEDKWELVLNKCLAIMQEIIKMETVCVVDALSKDNRCRLVECLTVLCVRQVNSEASKIPLGHMLPWILLHYILLRDEHRQQAKKSVKHIKKDVQTEALIEPVEEDIPPSVAILFSAHEFLGPRGWCLINNGELLHFILDAIINRLDTPIFELLREKIDLYLEQAFFCLYQHPSKKNKVSRHLADHNVNPLPLSWPRAQQLYEFFCPDALPEFDSYKSISISSELEQLLQRITSIVPKECDPQPLLAKVKEYINGAVNALPKPVDFPIKTQAMYYLLGDYFFKQSEVNKSKKFFYLDLCINPERIDTWAGLALGTHSQLESKLNHCERFKTEMDFIDRAKSARICFREALKLNDSHVTLWIEFGSFEYMVHSYCSRVLKYESDTLSMEKFEILENEKESYLESSRKSFEQALALYRLDQGEADERWLYHYMLAKIGEKKQEDPNMYLQHYLSATSLLHENKCEYPDKINYNNPQHLSLEALEVHYRINASILKYLELHEGKIIPATLGKLFKKSLDSSMIQKCKYECKAQNKPEVKEPQKNAQDDKLTDEVKTCLEDILKQVDKDEPEKSPDVVLIESDEEKKPVEEVKMPKISVRNVQDIMDEMMKETMEKTQSQPYSEVDNSMITEVELPKGDLDFKMDGIVEPTIPVPEKKEIVNKSDDENKKSAEESSTSSSSSSSSESSDSESDDSSSSSSSSSENSNENMSESDIMNLVDRCIVGLEHCIRRLPQNYKALYRLAHLYFSYSKKKDLGKCKQLLLGEYKCKNSVLVTGLFSDRKTTNFFNGIWRIPSSEIDRPGSLSAHMGRCVSLLLQVLRDTNDHKTLLELCLQLRRIPDPDKVYIRHCEREQLSEQALTMCIQTFRTQIKNVLTLTPAAAEKLLVDLYKAFQRSQKNLAHQEKVFSSMLVEAYKLLMAEKSESPNTLDMAIKYCQQSRVAEKQKKAQQQALAMPKATPMQAPPPPVLPTPSNVGASLNPPLKRPSLGRPRGRPPGPKMANQTRSPRGRSPHTTGGNPYSWQNHLFSSQTGLDYLKQYQEELLRQYNTLNNMNTLNSMFGNPNLLNPAVSSANMMNPTSLVQTLQQMNTGINTLAANQLSQSLSQLNPSLLKKISSQLTTPAQPTAAQMNQMFSNMSADKLRQLAALGQVKPTKSSSPQSKQHKMKNQYHPTVSKSMPISSSGFKYPTADITKSKIKDITKTTASCYMQQKDIPKAHSMKPLIMEKSLIKDRPNISITPVTQTTNTAPAKTIVSSPGKTLQEKLADKQKQQKNAAKSLDFSAAVKAYNASFNMPLPQLPKSLDVIPNYLLDSGLSISQVAQKGLEISPVKHDQGKSKPVVQNLPISMSVIRKEDPKSKSDNDVIIIE